MLPARVLIIAGSDSGGGAGIQADIKAVAALGGHAMCVVTALTAQNTKGVSAVHPVPLDFVSAQFKAVAEDIGLDAVKTGMLYSPELVELVSGLIRGTGVPVVVDPVMVAKGGDRLLSKEAVLAVKTHLIPLATLITPNLDEAEELLGRKVRDLAGMQQAARDLVALGAKAALIKGGHLEDQPADVLYDGNEIHVFEAPRIDTPHTHGTGCTLASSLATLLAAGASPAQAVTRARLLVRRAIMGSIPLGRGHGPVHAMADLAPRLALGEALEEVQDALDRLECVPGLGRMLPEVRGQIGYGLPHAQSREDVIAVAGRITDISGRMRAAGPPRAGASSHVAKIVLAAMKKDPDMRCAMALRFDEAMLKSAAGSGFSVGEFSRADEPAEVKALEGSTLEWGTQKVVNEMDMVPDLIFDRGEDGKEPVTRLLAKNPARLVEKLFTLAGVKE